MPTGGPSRRTVLSRAVAGQRRDVLLSSILSAGHQTGEAMVPVLIGVVVDRAVATGDPGALVRWLTVLAAVFAALSMSFRFGARAGERAAERAGHELRIELTRRVLDHRGGAEAGRRSGALVDIATEAADRVGAVNMAVPMGIAAAAGLLAGAVALVRVSLPLGLLVLIGAPLLLVLAHLLGRPLERHSGAERERAAHASGIAADLVAGLRVLKGIGAESAAVARYRHTSRRALTATLRAARAHAWHDGVMLAVTGILLAAIALVGGRLAAAGRISVGDLVAAAGLAQFLLGPLSLFAWVNGELARGRAAAGQVASVLAAPHAVPAAARPHAGPIRPAAGRLRLRGLTHDPLYELDLEIAAGELVGIVPTDPAAATALLACLGREHDPEAGSIELDGVPLSALEPGEVRAAILTAAHDAPLFEGSLIDNVRAAAGDPAAIEPAMAAAAADEVARALPQGADTPLTERGRSLSGGQRQRVALARALAAARPVLVVHDPTTAVDAATEAEIAAGIRTMRRGRTTVLVTSSPALLAVTDRVVLLDGGTVSATGTHTGLVAGDERYRATVLA